jgi:peroxiredoxin
MAPEFALESLDGKTVHLSDFQRKAVLLNFWATWCDVAEAAAEARLASDAV